MLKESIDKRNLRLKNYLKFLLNVENGNQKLNELGFRKDKQTENAKKPSEVTVRNGIQAKVKSFYSARGSPISYSMKSRKSGANKREITLNKSLTIEWLDEVLKKKGIID